MNRAWAREICTLESLDFVLAALLGVCATFYIRLAIRVLRGQNRMATPAMGATFLVVGLWGVFTSAFGYCPFNGLLNRNTCQIDLSSSKA